MRYGVFLEALGLSHLLSDQQLLTERSAKHFWGYIGFYRDYVGVIFGYWKRKWKLVKVEGSRFDV